MQPFSPGPWPRGHRTVLVTDDSSVSSAGIADQVGWWNTRCPQRVVAGSLRSTHSAATAALGGATAIDSDLDDPAEIDALAGAVRAAAASVSPAGVVAVVAAAGSVAALLAAAGWDSVGDSVTVLELTVDPAAGWEPVLAHSLTVDPG